MIIAHNMAAYNAGRQCKLNTERKAKSMEKLSSGYRINRSADDAAGLSISEKMRKQIRGLSQGVRNTQDGVSLCQVADGALAEVNDMLHRITELSVKSANGTNSDTDRDAIQKEISEILCEIDRIGGTTKFNEQKLFTGQEYHSSEMVDTSGAGGIDGTVDAGTGVDTGTDTTVADIKTSFSITGAPIGIAAGSYTVSALQTGFRIGSDTFAWSDFAKADGSTLSFDAPAAGMYQMSYKGLEIGFKLQGGATSDQILSALDGASFEINSVSKSSSPVTLTGYSLTAGTRTDELLTGGWHTYGRETAIKAGDMGISICGYNSTTSSFNKVYSTISWDSLGIAAGANSSQTLVVNDSVSGISFQAQVAEGATRDEIISAMNGSHFVWQYVDNSPTENAILGIKVTNTGTSTPFQRSDEAKTAEVFTNSATISHNGDDVSRDLYEQMGYTTPSSRLNGMVLDIAMHYDSTKAGSNQLTATITNNTNGNSVNAFFSGESSSNKFTLKTLNGSGQSSIIMNMTCGGNGASTEIQKINILKDLDGKKLATLTVPSPYTFSMTEFKQTTSTSLELGAVKTKEDVVTPPAPDPGDTGDKPGDDAEDTGAGDVGILSAESNSIWIQAGADAGDGFFLTIDKMNTDTLGLRGLDVSTEAGANDAISRMDGVLAKVSRNRSRIGAQQNRLEHIIANENNIVENTTAAESRIRDTDMAKEMVEYSKCNILEQVSQAMLAQANQSTQGVLSLFQ